MPKKTAKRAKKKMTTVARKIRKTTAKLAKKATKKVKAAKKFARGIIKSKSKTRTKAKAVRKPARKPLTIAATTFKNTEANPVVASPPRSEPITSFLPEPAVTLPAESQETPSEVTPAAPNSDADTGPH